MRRLNPKLIKAVAHLMLSPAPDDPPLTDEQWQAIAQHYGFIKIFRKFNLCNLDVMPGIIYLLYRQMAQMQFETKIADAVLIVNVQAFNYSIQKIFGNHHRTSIAGKEKREFNTCCPAQV